MFFCSKGFSLNHGSSRGLLIARAAFPPPCTPIGCVAQCYADLCSSLNQPAASGLQHETSYLPYALATMSQPPQGTWANPGAPWVQPPNPTPPGTALQPPSLLQPTPHLQSSPRPLPQAEFAPAIPPGFQGPATLHPILHAAVIGYTSDGRPWFAAPIQQNAGNQQAESPRQSDFQMMAQAITSAIRSASPLQQQPQQGIGSSTSASAFGRPPESQLERCSEKISASVVAALPAVQSNVARRISFDGTPRNASSTSTNTGNHAVIQLVARSGFPASMTQQQLNTAAETLSDATDISIVTSCFRDIDKKNVTTVLTACTAPPAPWTQLTVEKGMSDTCIDAIMSWLDVPVDMLECIKASIGGRLIIVADENVSPENQKICIQYQRIYESSLEFGYNPFAVVMKRYMHEMSRTLVHVPASILALKDRHVVHKLLQALPAATRDHIVAGKSENEPLTVPHLIIKCLRFNYKPTKDDPRKVSVAKAFLHPLSDFKTYEQFVTHWQRIKREFLQLKSRDVHANDPIEERECILLLLQTRSWMNSFKKRWQEKGWPDTTEGLLAKLKYEMDNEDPSSEKNRYSNRFNKINAVLQREGLGGIDHDTYNDELHYSVHAIGAKDMKKPHHKRPRPASAPPYEHADSRQRRDRTEHAREGRDRDRTEHARESRERDRRDTRAPTRFSSSREDRRFHITGGSAPPDERRRDRSESHTMRRNRQHVRRMGISGQHRDSGMKEGTRYLLGRTNPAPPGWHCPGCKSDRCVGRCPVCLAENSCSASHRGNCPFRHSTFSDPKTWDRKWFREGQHEPCMRCGNVGHPYSACPEKDKRQVLARTVMHEGKHRNAIVAFLTLKDGHSPPEDETDVEALKQAYHIEYSDGCRDHAHCGHAHEYDVAHVYTPDMRVDLDSTCMPSSVYVTLSQEYGTEMDYAGEVSEGGHALEESSGEESESSLALPVFALETLEHDLPSESGDSPLIALAMSDGSDLGAIWDTGAMRSVNKTEVGATGYVTASTAKLRAADGGVMENRGEADFEALHATRQGPPHTMTRNAPICPKAPVNIISAGEKFRQGYGAAHNLDGVFIPRNSDAYNRVRVLLRRGDRYLELHKDEHQVVTPDLKQIMLVQKKPNLFFLEPLQPTTTVESEHLKDVRKQDPRYSSKHTIGMLSAEDQLKQYDDQITHDKGLEYYTTTAQALLGKVEQLQRDLAFASAHDDALSEALISALHSMHNVYETLTDADTSTRHDEFVRQNVERMHADALHTVCTRCELPVSEKEKGCGGATACRNTCRECKCTVQGKHFPDFSCKQRCAASDTITVLKQSTRDQMLTGAVHAAHEQDDVHEQNMQRHHDLHKDCDRHPCKVCKLHTQSDCTPDAPDIVARISDEAIVAAFESLQLGKHATPVATHVATITATGICTTCRHHHTGCRCKNATTGKHANKLGKCVHKSCIRRAAYTGVGKICAECDPKMHESCGKCIHAASHAHTHREGESEDAVIERWVGHMASGGGATSHAFASIDHVMPVTRSTVRSASVTGKPVAVRTASADIEHPTVRTASVAPSVRSASVGSHKSAVRTASAAPSVRTASDGPRKSTVRTASVASAVRDTSVGKPKSTVRTASVAPSVRSASVGIEHPTHKPATASLAHSSTTCGPAAERAATASTSTSTSADEQVVGRGKRKGEDVTLDKRTMMSIIGKHAWKSILDDTSMYPSVLSFSPAEWLMQLPDDLRNALAVLYQNKVTAQLKHDMVCMQHGSDSEQAMHASAKHATEHRAYMEAVAFMSRVAETMLTASTNA